jgi:hypothetical protein
MNRSQSSQATDSRGSRRLLITAIAAEIAWLVVLAVMVAMR